MTFYPDLRDDTAGPLITQFGQPGVYRVYGAEVYDNTTGKTTRGTPSNTTVSMLDLPIRERVFTKQVTEMSSAFLLVSAKEFAAAGVTPEVDEHIVFGSKTYRILAINTIGPAGIAVAYKMAVQYA